MFVAEDYIVVVLPLTCGLWTSRGTVQFGSLAVIACQAFRGQSNCICILLGESRCSRTIITTRAGVGRLKLNMTGVIERHSNPDYSRMCISIG